MPRLAPTLALLLLAAAALRGGAQRVEGRVVTGDSARAVGNAVVLLVDSTGREVARTLADEGGRFGLAAPGVGAYRVRVLRIGFQPAEGSVLAVGAGTTAVPPLVMRPVVATLATVRVTGKNECRARASTGPAALALWEAARTALLGTILTGSERKPVMTLVRFERVVDTAGARVVRQRVRRSMGESMRSFVAASPAEEFARRGYLVRSMGEIEYWAPDADVLLSESFATAHCFRLDPASDRRAGEVGLAFEPTQRRDDFVDVAGTLWLDRATSELRRLEYRYEGDDQVVTEGRAGGRIDFQRLPNGLWVISGWHMRMPRLVAVTDRTTGARRPGIAAYTVNGGVLSEVRIDGDVAWAGRTGAVDGRVVERREGAPVRGASVALEGTDYATLTDSAGRFRFDGVLPGRYGVTARPPVADALSLPDDDAATVDVPDSGTASVAVPVPSVAEAIERACGRRGRDPRLGVVAGLVRQPDGTAAAEATIRAEWLAEVELRGGASARQDVATGRTDGDGRFQLCGVARGRRVTITAVRDSLRATTSARVEDDLPVASVEVVLGRPAPSAAEVVASGTAGESGPPGFAARRHLPTGTFLDSAQIAARHATTIDQILRIVGGVELDAAGAARPAHPPGDLREPLAIGGARDGTRPTDVRAPACATMQVVVDGATVMQPFDLRTIDPARIRAVEVYRATASVPAELHVPDSPCGTLVLWTR